MSEGSTFINEATLQEFLMRDAERLCRYVASKIPPDLRSLVSPDDVLQEVWMVAFRGVASFRADGPDALPRWMTTLANRRLLDIFRTARALKRRGHRLELEDTPERISSMIDLLNQIAASTATPSSEASAKEVAQAVQIALASLPDDRRRVMWMRHIEGRSVEEIAVVMHKTVAAVRGLLFRARKQMCDRLGRASQFFSGMAPARKSIV